MKRFLLALTSAGMLISVLPVTAAIVYVDVNSTNPTAPFLGWSTAARTIQDGVDAAGIGDTILVTNGIYQTGGRAISYQYLTNRVLVTKAVTVRSVNGPGVTVIRGFQGRGTWSSVRCVYLTTNAAIAGFTVESGSTASDYSSGGGIYCNDNSATISNCVITGNIALDSGGGCYGGTVQNCVIASNSASMGGGAAYGALSSCFITGNSADYNGGGAYNCSLTNCTVTRNSASISGGGIYVESSYPSISSLNCLIYFNNATRGANYDGIGNSLYYCCTTPATYGTGNIGVDPVLADWGHITAGSPCRAAGRNVAGTAVDIDGDAWSSPPSIGCDEFNPNSITGPLGTEVQATYTNLIIGCQVIFSAAIEGHVGWNSWDFADGTTVSNRLFVSHAWSVPGDYRVSFTVFNYSNPAGIMSSITVHVLTNAIYYVAAESANPLFPYDSWKTAARDIQSAVDAVAYAGATVLVSNGVYNIGSRAASGRLALNRVAVTKPLLLQSINGPTVTEIRGFQDPQTVYGSQAVRGVYLCDGATLSGFTISGGATSDSGDIQTELNGGGIWCASSFACVSNCVVIGNAAAEAGGGVYSGRLQNCALIGNSARIQSGGCDSGILVNCTLTGNSAGQNAGGSGGGSLTNCLIYYNQAPNYTNCMGGSLDHCCTTLLPYQFVSGNLSAEPMLTDNYHLSSASACRGAGNATAAQGIDIDGEPWMNPPSIGCDEYQLGNTLGPLNVRAEASYTNVAAGYLSSFSADITGHAGISYWDFGDGTIVTNMPYVSHTWSQPGNYMVTLWVFNQSNPIGVSFTMAVHVFTSPVHYVSAANPTAIPPYISWATAATNIQDAVDAAFGGASVLVLNGVYSHGGRVVFGTMTNRVAVWKPLEVRSVSGPAVTIIEGYQAPGVTNDQTSMRCAFVANGATLAGFTLRKGATHTSGDVEKEISGGGVLCESSEAVVSNCVLSGNAASFYAGGAYSGTLNNCELRQNWCSFIGGGAYSSVMNNCTVVSNYASFGGGARGATLNHCVVADNSASFGGGADECAMNFCLLMHNSAITSGGGGLMGSFNNCIIASNSTAGAGGGLNMASLTNCTVIGNSAAGSGGGAYQSKLKNCIVFYNTATTGPNYSGGSWTNCATTPVPTGSGNINAEPLFVSLPSGIFQLNSNSPCINAGNNAFATNSTDFDGNPRISGGTVDIGAYEFQNPASTISYAWLQQYGLPVDGSADTADTDGDRLNNWQEWRAGTSPIDSASVLKMLTLTNGISGTTVSWQSVSGINYVLQRSDLIGGAGFSTIQTNIVGQAGSTSFTDTNAIGSAKMVYRVGVGW